MFLLIEVEGKRVLMYSQIHLGPLKGPFPVHESQGRHAPVETNPDFYFEQEDFLKAFQKEGKKWTYTLTLPSNIVGVTRGLFSSFSFLPPSPYLIFFF
jgi:hypothetical protein